MGRALSTRSGTATSSRAATADPTPICRPPPRPRGHLAAGVRGPPARRPQGAPAGPDVRDARPQRADRRRPITDRGRGSSWTHSRERRRVRRPAARVRQRPRGIVHVIGPELGLTQPGMTIVCGDSHTSTHGALGALAFGIGTSEVEHVLATQTLPQRRPKTMASGRGDAPPGVTREGPRARLIGRSGSTAASATWSSTRAPRSGPCRWKAA